MYLFVVALHVVLCLFMVLIILLQPAKGEVGLAFGGGGSSTVFGPRGPASILQRATTIVAVMFMGTSITLALYSNQSMMATGNVDDEFDAIRKEIQAEKNPVPEASPAPDAPPSEVPAPE
ncbi:MAG: preprotein translocase subunit SecG [Alphaproteobacteria bacterium]|nr:preprotein translocase subunit SecG [Alphaproteobacteria bacterium]